MLRAALNRPESSYAYMLRPMSEHHYFFFYDPPAGDFYDDIPDRWERIARHGAIVPVGSLTSEELERVLPVVTEAGQIDEPYSEYSSSDRLGYAKTGDIPQESVRFVQENATRTLERIRQDRRPPTITPIHDDAVTRFFALQALKTALDEAARVRDSRKATPESLNRLSRIPAASSAPAAPKPVDLAPRKGKTEIDRHVYDLACSGQYSYKEIAAVYDKTESWARRRSRQYATDNGLDPPDSRRQVPTKQKD